MKGETGGGPGKLGLGSQPLKEEGRERLRRRSSSRVEMPCVRGTGLS